MFRLESKISPSHGAFMMRHSDRSATNAPSSSLRAFFAQFILTVAPVENAPLGAALDYATFERGDLFTDGQIHGITLVDPFGQQFTSIAQCHLEIGNLRELFILEPRQRLTRQIQYPRVRQFHEAPFV